MMLGRDRVIALGMALLALGACQEPGGAVGSRPSASGFEPFTQVEIIDGAQFTAIWQAEPSTQVRLTYDATAAVSDTRLLEIAQQLTGCTPTGGLTEPTLVGGIATLLVTASCPPVPAGTI